MQFFKLQNANSKHDFLQENQYIKYDLLELQELMVKAGYIQPDEVRLGHVDKTIFDDESRVTELGMQRATDVFYDHVLNLRQDLLSPQYEQFYDASISSSHETTEQAKAPKRVSTEVENHNKISLYTLSSTLVGVQQQVLSYRRDAVDMDYPTEFYEKYLDPDAFMADMVVVQDANEKSELLKKRPKHVLMERSYLNGWRTFMQHTEDILPKIQRLVEDDFNDMNGQMAGLRALSACKFEAKELRD